MARQRTQAPSLTAAAKRINLREPRAKAALSKNTPWQKDAWAYFEIPEIKESLRYRGNQLAKVRLYVAVRNPDDPGGDPIPAIDPASGVPPQVAAAAEEELARLKSSVGGQPAIQRSLDINLEVAGECFLVGMAEREEKVTQRDGSEKLVLVPEDWNIRSVSEVEVKGSGQAPKYLIKSDENDTKGTELDPDRDTIIRIWIPDPQWSNRPDSTMRGLLVECQIVQLLTQQLIAHCYRALSAGILTVANELSSGPTMPTDPEGEPYDLVMDALDIALAEPIENPSGSSTVQPALLRGPGQWLTPEYLRIIRFYDPEIIAGLEARIEARLVRIFRGLNLPVEKIEGHMRCVTTDTQIMTSEGWKTHETLRVGDVALTLNHRTGLAEWQQVDAVSVYDCDQPLVELTGRSHSSLSTPDHHWPVVTQRGARRWYDSADLNTNCRIIPSASLAGLPDEPKWSDALVELVAWFWTEGTRYPAGGGMIYQSQTANPGHVANIRRALTALVGPAEESLYASARKSGRAVCSFDDCGWPIHAHGLCASHRGQDRIGIPLRPVRRYTPLPANTDERRPAWREFTMPDGMVRFRLNHLLMAEVDVLAPDKVPSFEFIRSLTPAQLELFIQRSTDADGYHTRTGAIQLHQSDERRAAAFEFACILSGRAVRRSIRPSTSGGPGSLRHLVLARWGASQRVGYGIQKRTVHHTGQVWCPTVANGTWLARREGTTYFTGNTTFANARQIDEDEYEDYLQPSADMSNQALTYAFLRPQLAENPAVPAEWVEPLFIHGDPSDLFATPDTEANADSAWDRGAISDESYRKAKGFGDEDAPDPEELLIRAALKSGRMSADVTLAVLNLMGVPLDVEPGAAGQDPNPPAVTASVVRTMHAIRAASRPVSNDYGRRLTELDRELRSRLITAANVAMSAALDRAANRLRTKTNGSPIRASLQTVPRRSWFAHLGPSLVAEAMGEEDPMAGAWDGLEDEFMAWGSDAQAQARSVVEQATGRDQSGLADQQADDLSGAWHWLLAALSTLATDRLWNPDPSAPDIGEHDPTVMIPAGLIRSAISRAGGSAGLSTSGTDAWVTLTDSGSRPAGGIGTGELVRGALRDGGAQVEGYVWRYGPAFRKDPFEPHYRLDGQPFVNFDDDVLASDGTFGFAFWMPGDHGSCRCDSEPTILSADER